MFLKCDIRELYRTSLQKSYDWRQTNFGQKLLFPFRYGWYGLYKGILMFKVGTFDPANTVFISGSIRSGTTWLSELLCTQKDYCLLFEPTSTDLWNLQLNVPASYWRESIGPDSNWPEGEELFAKLFKGGFAPPNALILNSPLDLIRCNSLIIKCVGTNMLLPWLAARFQIRGMIFILRHPCAVVNSVKKHRKIPQQIPIRRQRYIEKNLPHLASYIQNLRTEEEILAVTWCCDHYAPLKYRRNDTWIQVSYEKLVLEGQKELKRIYNALGFSETVETRANLRSNSLTTHKWTVDHSLASVEERLGNWKRTLNGDAVKRILSVVETFGIQGFGDNIVPYFDKIGIAT